MSETSKRVALYARVSTEDQSPELQLRGLRELVAQRDWTLAGTFVDVGFSGAKTSRPELNKLLTAARAKAFDVVACWKFDRFARSTKHLVLALDEFRSLGIDFISVTEAIDTSTAIGRALFTIVSAIAEFERELIKERVRAGVARRKAAGKPVGRQRRATPFQVDRIVALRREGRSWRRIAMAVGLPTSTVRDAHREACGKPDTTGAPGNPLPTASQGAVLDPSD